MPTSDMISQVNAGNFTDIVTLLNYGTCVKTCPVADSDVAIECYETNYMRNNADKYANCMNYPGGVSSGVPFRYEAQGFLGHFCIPSSSYTDSENMKKAFSDAFFNSVLGNQATTYFYDIYKSWAVILVASLLAVIVAYMYLFLIRYLGGVIIWLSFAVSFLVILGAGFYSYFWARP